MVVARRGDCGVWNLDFEYAADLRRYRVLRFRRCDANRKSCRALFQ